ncbi:hypothetical protein BPAE_0001g02480 [Botrytis paeoniae]|uniref:FAD/NAD(P)-binding domain-containing protein n=1 Tax=Botrytis paeoniae TaxID=278948 RepID=A0A4Z1GBC2_9HELO|nr:hypothetical protein BPAE_0001g02480 [Botrytis paeoniae]
MSQSPPIDVLIIGSGPASLTAAPTLARQLHTAIVFDSGDYRNLEASYMHMVLTWDHKSPKQFRTSARREIENNYNTIRFEDVELKTVKQTEAGFEVADGNGKTWVGKKLILATGSASDFPDIPDSSSKASDRFAVDNRKISRLVKGDQGAEVILKFEDGSAKTESFITHNPNTHTIGPFAEQLGLKLIQTGDIDASAPSYTTSVRGVFAAGDSITPYKVVDGALSSGCNAAVAAVAQLRAEDLGHQPFS